MAFEETASSFPSQVLTSHALKLVDHRKLTCICQLQNSHQAFLHAASKMPLELCLV